MSGLWIGPTSLVANRDRNRAAARLGELPWWRRRVDLAAAALSTGGGGLVVGGFGFHFMIC